MHAPDGLDKTANNFMCFRVSVIERKGFSFNDSGGVKLCYPKMSKMSILKTILECSIQTTTPFGTLWLQLDNLDNRNRILRLFFWILWKTGSKFMPVSFILEL